jgi:hypothetical protein
MEKQLEKQLESNGKQMESNGKPIDPIGNNSPPIAPRKTRNPLFFSLDDARRQPNQPILAIVSPNCARKCKMP